LIAIKYSIYFVIAILINLLFQYLLDLFLKGVFQVYISIAAGIKAGLFIKYFRDKKYIFSFQIITFKTDFLMFVLFSVMGIATTIIFWGTELVFFFYLSFCSAKHIGGLPGFSVAYYIK